MIPDWYAILYEVPGDLPDFAPRGACGKQKQKSRNTNRKKTTPPSVVLTTPSTIISTRSKSSSRKRWTTAEDCEVFDEVAREAASGVNEKLGVSELAYERRACVR